jgi:carbamate kinase
VDEKDPLFNSPSKPIGSFYSKEEAEQIAKEKGYIMKEDAGRGYRRVVPSPLPIDIIEKESIKALLDDGQVVICAGGGGIPVINKNNKLEGVAAVIDKDYASAKLAELIDADYLVILTAVNNVCLNYKQENEVVLKDVKKGDLAKYLEEGHFAKGSMYPKVQAVLNFLKDINKTAVIASLDNAKDAVKLKAGTIIK